MRKEFTRAVRRAAYARAKSQCEGIRNGERCVVIFSIGKYHYDHDIPDGQGGEATLENCRVLCLACHADKTRLDISAIAKTYRIADCFIGIKPARKKIQSRGFQKAEPQHTATRPISRNRRL